jgi:hypothetical protein
MVIVSRLRPDRVEQPGQPRAARRLMSACAGAGHYVPGAFQRLILPVQSSQKRTSVAWGYPIRRPRPPWFGTSPDFKRRATDYQTIRLNH